MTENRFFKKAYTLLEPSQTMQLYSEWAESYDETMVNFDYQTPRRCAEALHRHNAHPDIKIMDVGCGSGISGQALKEAGFKHIDGSDISAEMLEKAALRKAVYRTLTQVHLPHPFDFDKGAYQAITAMGVIAENHAPPEAIRQLIEKLDKGGLLVFSLNNHTLENEDYMKSCIAVCTDGLAEILEQEEGPHITQLEMTSKIMVMRRL